MDKLDEFRAALNACLREYVGGKISFAELQEVMDEKITNFHDDSYGEGWHDGCEYGETHQSPLQG